MTFTDDLKQGDSIITTDEDQVLQSELGNLVNSSNRNRMKLTGVKCCKYNN